jgi:hypothetical protein
MGQVSYSPEIQQARLSIDAWSLLRKKAIGLKISSRLLSRTLRKANIHFSLKKAGEQMIVDHLLAAFKHYYSIKGSHKELRHTAIEKRAEAIAAEGNLEKGKVLKEIRQRERQRDTAKKIRFLRGKVSTGSTTLVTVQDANGISVDLTNKEDIERAIISNNEDKCKQSFHTPFLQPPLVSEFGFKGLTPASNLVLAGCYVPKEPIDPYAQDLITELKMPQPIKDIGRQSMELSVTNYKKFWNKAKENTSCYPDALSFSTMKAGSRSDMIAELECTLINIPLTSGYSPSCWKHLLDVMIMKKLGNTLLNALRTIVLFPVDCNYAFKHIGREMMKLGEKTYSIAPKQYGSCNNHRAIIDLAVNKSLTNDILHQLKRPGAICCNDAKSCYDLIGHTQASLSMQRLGVPTHAVDCLFSTLQNATHQVRTAYGDSDYTYGGSDWDIPMHGIGQGNGAGPAIWAAVSTPILNMLRSQGLGCQFISPFSNQITQFVWLLFC